MTRRSTIGTILLLIAVVVFGLLWYKNRSNASIPLVFSTRAMYEALWQDYKKVYVEKDTYRTINLQQDNVTTSEGQSYTMMRAVQMDDQVTFDGAWQWTKDNLGRDEDKLLSWLFGKGKNGNYEVLKDQGGHNSASDADVDIALSLIFAYNRWHRDQYRGDALAIMKDIWEKEVVTINGTPYLMANDLERLSTEKMIINPSYLAPYAYRIFAKIDTYRDWDALVDSSYEVLNKVTTSKLPPDWIVINKKTGEFSAPNVSNLTTNYGFDAIRIPWRIAVDYQWNKEPRAKAYLDKLSFFTDEWNKKGKLGATYSADGNVINEAEVPAMYGAALGYFMVSDPAHAEEVYNKKLKSLYNPDTTSWKKLLSYYDDNWAWFGIGLYNNFIKPF